MFSSLTSFITSSISSLPFKVLSDEIIHPSQSIVQGGGLWKQYQGIRIPTGMTGAIAVAGGANHAQHESISIFTFDKRNASSDQQALAKNALQRIKTLRHPNILKYIDSIDLPTHLHILTEQVLPLTFEPIQLNDHVGQLAASLGLHQITTTLSWLNNDAKLIHSNLHPGSLYITDSGDWKLFGLDLCFKGTETIPDVIIAGRNSGILPVQYRAQELMKSAGSAAPPSVIHSTDAWSLGCLIYHIFNANFSSPQQLASPGNIPSTLSPDYKKLLATNPMNRLNPKTLLEGSLFFQNDLVSTVVFLENLAIKSTDEKTSFFIHFSEHMNDFPTKFCKYKILPQLTKSLDYGSGLACFSAILRSILKIGSNLTMEEYSTQVLPCLIKLFGSNERQIRVHLLQNLGDYASSLSSELINEQLFGHVLTGFGDANPTLRELTVKSLMHFAPKLSSTNMDHALKWIGKLQTDTEPAIRTNTGYCLAKIAPYLTPATAEKVLIVAFTKMLRDPFPPARVAGLTALAATLEQTKPVDLARKVLPCATPMLADEVYDVRMAAFKLVEQSMRVMATWSAAEKTRQDSMPTTTAMGSAPPPQSQPDVSAAPAAAAAAVLGSFGSWAVGAVRSKISNADTNQPPKHLAGANQHAPPASSGFASSSSTKSAYASSSTGAPVSSTSGGSSFDTDDFFDDFSSKGADEDEDDLIPVTVLTTKKEKTTTRKQSTDKRPPKEKKSILAGGATTGSKSPFAISPPPGDDGSKSSSNWDFDIDSNSSTVAANADLLDDFDSWDSKPSSKAPSSSASSSTATFDLLSASTATQHKKSPSNMTTAADPFAALTLTGSSPKPPAASPTGMTLTTNKPKASTIAPMTLGSRATPAATTAKAKTVDDWGDFLNS